MFKGGTQGTELGWPVQISTDTWPKGRTTLRAKTRHGEVPPTGKPDRRGRRSGPGLLTAAVRGRATWSDLAHPGTYPDVPPWGSWDPSSQHGVSRRGRWLDGRKTQSETRPPAAALDQPHELGVLPWTGRGAGQRVGEVNRSGTCPAVAHPETAPPPPPTATRPGTGGRPVCPASHGLREQSRRSTKMASCQAH